MAAEPPPKRIRVYRRCCKSLLEHIRQELNDECSRGQLKHGVRGAYHHTIDEEMADPSGASAASSSGNA